MSANTILTSIVTGGTNSHATVVEEANAVATDFVTQGVVGAITINSGSGGTGSFCVNADASPDMGITIKAGQAYISATPSGQNAQVLRARASTDYTTYTINSNSSGSTKYDWIYLSVSATNANTPDSAADNVTSVFTSRSTSNSSDTGSPPTYGLLLAIVTVANAASSITNSNITDRRFNASIGAQNGSLIVTQSATGQNAKVQAAGVDANVSLELDPKGTGTVVVSSTTGLGIAWASWTPTWTNLTIGNAVVQYGYIQIGKTVLFRFDVTLGTTSSVGNTPTFTLPVTARSGIYSSESQFGPLGLTDSGVNAYQGAVRYNSTTTGTLVVFNTASTYATLAVVTGSVPVALGNGDIISGFGHYEAA